MALNLGQLHIYNFQVDELRPVTNPGQKSEWEKRLAEQAKVAGFRVPDGAQLLDTCCGGSPDDCGIIL